jgi:hypothetical protein
MKIGLFLSLMLLVASCVQAGLVTDAVTEHKIAVSQEQQAVCKRLQPWLITLYYARQNNLNALTVLKTSLAISHLRSLGIPTECNPILDRYVLSIKGKDFIHAEKAYNEFTDLISAQHLDKTTIATIAQEKMNTLAKY